MAGLGADGLGSAARLANGPVPLKPIAASRDRLEQPAILPERLPDRGDMNLKRIVFDDGARPHSLKKLVLGDELSGHSRQRLENFESAAADRHHLSARAQFAQLQIELPVAAFEKRDRAA